MSIKTKINAEKLIKHMSGAELRKYKIAVENEDGKDSTPSWFREFFKQFNEFKQDMTKRWDKQEQFNEEMLQFKQDQDKRWDKQEQFNNLVLAQFKKHKWIK